MDNTNTTPDSELFATNCSVEYDPVDYAVPAPPGSSSWEEHFAAQHASSSPGPVTPVASSPSVSPSVAKRLQELDAERELLLAQSAAPTPIEPAIESPSLAPSLEPPFLAPHNEVVVSPRAQRLQAQSASESGPGDEGNGVIDDCAFRDSSLYAASSLTFKTVTIHLRELSEETCAQIDNICPAIEAATDGRVPASLAQVLFTGLKDATDKEKEALRAVSAKDVVAIKEMMTALTSKVMSEGISRWESSIPGATMRPCTDENISKLGAQIRTDCLAQIMVLSGYGDKQQDFLAGS